MRLLGVINAFNEEDCIDRAITSLSGAGHDVHVFDHGSTDRTAEIAGDLRASVHWVDPAKVGRGKPGKPSRAIWTHVSKWIVSQNAAFGWVTWQAADELIFDGFGKPMSGDALEREVRGGVQVIRPLIMEFWPTVDDKAEADCPDYVERLRWYTVRPRSHAPRFWQLRLTGTMPRGLHRADPALPRYRAEDERWPRGTKVSNNQWQIRHYPIRSLEQARRKILHERPWNPPQYRNFKARQLRNLQRKTQGMKRLAA